MSQDKKISYKDSGVDYSKLDSFKRMCQVAAATTGDLIYRDGESYAEVASSRGESAYLVELGNTYIAHVEEGLGTKNLIADAMYKLTGRCRYDDVAQDNVAMAINDLITSGAIPISYALHVACGDSSWFEDKVRAAALAEGTRRACALAQCSWGPGETPTLKGIVNPETVLLSGSAVGVIGSADPDPTWSGLIDEEDVLVGLESSGIHANGATLCRSIADKLPDGYLTKLANDQTYGDALLEPTLIYAQFVEQCRIRGVNIHYAINVTGHGWRKIMRAEKELTYVIDQLPSQKPIFDFIQKASLLSDREMYETFNMGIGFIVIVHKEDLVEVMEAAKQDPGGKMVAFVAGRVESGPKQVVIEPLNITFKGEELQIR